MSNRFARLSTRSLMFAFAFTSTAHAGGAPDLSKAPAVSAAEPWQAPTPSSANTASGVRLVVLPQRELPIVHLLLVVQAGSERDPPGQPGVAALTARMLEEGGGGKLSGPALSAALDELGGELHVDVDESGARFFLTVLSTKLDRALELLGDMIARPRFDPAEWPSVKSRQLAELARDRDQPRKIADEAFQHVLFGDHPYGHAAMGTPATVDKLTLEDVRRFYDKHYGPKVTTVILVGDSTVEQAARPVQAAFGAETVWQKNLTPSAAPPVAAEPGARFVIIDRPGAPQSEVRVGRVGVAFGSPELAPISLLEMVLGGSFTSRLNQNLREKHGYTYGAHAEFKLFRAAGPFVAAAAIRTDATAEAMKEIFAELGGMRAPLPEAELRKGRALVLQKIIETFGDGAQAAFLLGELVANDQPLDTWGRLQTRLLKLDAAAVTRLADKVLPTDGWIVVILGDRKVIEPKLRALPMAKTLELRNLDGDPLK